MRMNIIKRNLIAARIVLYLKHNDKAFYKEDNREQLVYPLYIYKAKENFRNAEQSAQILSALLEKSIRPEHLHYVTENDPFVMWTPFDGWMYDHTNGVFFTEKNGRQVLFMDKRVWYNPKNIIVMSNEPWLWRRVFFIIIFGFLIWLLLQNIP